MEGLYILGNADQLSRHSEMWRQIVEELAKDESIGDAFPVQCYHHPNKIEYVSKPGQLARFAPDGGCLQPCDYRLSCGHMCPYKCHPDDRNHVAVQCTQPCRRLCPREHPCNKRCSADCGKCTFTVTNVQLPCGHVKDFVPCYQVDELDTVTCHAMVTKRYNDCEHLVEVECSTETSTVSCNSACDGVMLCCGRTCSARCGKCKDLNTTIADDGCKIRADHVPHPCQKALYCGHLCGKKCSVDHTHNQECQEPCRQTCAHAVCKLTCSKPCAPCQEQCTWICPHEACPVPCGSVCARLPCDVRCSNRLRCGHQCPSVCGEDCSIQRCPICFPSQDPVDLVMFTTLEEISPEAQTLDELLITLPNCRHTFTVETLDGICNMGAYYEPSPEGGETSKAWIATRSPPTDFQSPPSCPTCRTVITSPRYGRIFKRANLDILERDVASSMSKSLTGIRTAMAQWDTESLSKTITTRARDFEHKQRKLDERQHVARSAARRKLLKEHREIPFQLDIIDPANVELYGLLPAVCSKWKEIARPLMIAYKLAVDVVSVRSAHTNAWESAVSYLFESEMKRISLEAEFPTSPDLALTKARQLVGPAPLSDQRFHVEAIWTSLDIRFTLAQLAMAWFEGTLNSKGYPAAERNLWATYGLFILRTVQSDASLAYDIARKSNSRRRMTKSVLWKMRADLERFRFNINIAEKSGLLRDDGERKRLFEETEILEKRATSTSSQTVEEHYHTLGSSPDESTWLNENFLKLAQTITGEWKSIARSLRTFTVYEPVSVAELQAVANAINVSFTGHWFRCAQGHPFVIGECGGARQASRCNECGSPIGGINYALHPTNTHVTNFEELAAQSRARAGQ